MLHPVDMKPPPGELRLLVLIHAAIVVAAGAVMLYFLRPIL
jgi:hypothetical protein